jgi:gluconate 2-dehydrogenase gamma chain
VGQQGVERREMLRILAAASAASEFPGFHLWAFVCDHEDQKGTALKRTKGPYEPQFFSADEYAIIERLTELIIPNDGQPGAHEAGVSEFIDFMIANKVDVGMHSYEPPSRKRPVYERNRVPDALKSRQSVQYLFRYGVNWLEAHARRLCGGSFRDCTEEQQTEMLEHLAYKDRYRAGEADGQAFFRLVREYTVMGFYTSRVGLEQLDFKGLQVVWAEMPECPHKNDPEHRHLPAPIS